MTAAKSRSARRQMRHARLRKRFSGSAERPRLAVFRSARHIYAQAIDDEAGRTLASASTRDKEIKPTLKSSAGNRDSAGNVGKAIAERLVKLGVKQVVFDRGGNRYLGRIKALADAAREGGLTF